jgi:hypothetical protein
MTTFTMWVKGARIAGSQPMQDWDIVIADPENPVATLRRLILMVQP